MIKYFKDLEVTFENVNEYKGHNFSFLENGLIKKVSIIDSFPNSESRGIRVFYHVEKFNVESGERESLVKGREDVHGDYYNIWYDTKTSLSLGDIIFKASVNLITEKILANTNAIFFNPLKDYDLFQPLFFDVDIVGDVATVTNLYGGEGKTVEYSIDGVNYKTENVFTGLDFGTHTIYAKTVEDGYPSITEFEILNEIVDE